MEKCRKGDLTLLGRIVQVDTLNGYMEPRYVIKTKNGDFTILDESDVEKIMLPIIGSNTAYRIIKAKRKGIGLAEFMRCYENESEHTLKTLVRAWLFGYTERD